MTTWDEWICNKCAVKEGLLGRSAPASALATAYQERKFQKHTAGYPGASVNSVFAGCDRAVYQERIERALERGAVQIDQRGRRNVFLAVNEPVGHTDMPSGQVTVSGEKVVLSENPKRIHAFPYGNAETPNKRCSR
jgi:hypothetical protein